MMKDSTVIKLAGIASGTAIIIVGATFGVDSTLTLLGGLALGTGLGIPVGAILGRQTDAKEGLAPPES